MGNFVIWYFFLTMSGGVAEVAVVGFGEAVLE